jgi:hypothetical protein
LFINNLFTSSYVAPAIAQTGGVLRLNGAQLLNGTANNSTITSSGGGDLDVQATLFGLNVASGAWTVPVVNFTGSGACRFENNVFREASPGDVGGLVIATDATKHVIGGNGWNGWKWSIPGVSGQYGFSRDLTAQKQMFLNALPGRGIQYNIDAQAGNQRSVNSTTAGSPRWALILGDAGAETGSNAGSDFSLARYNDAGGLIAGAPIAVSRSTGGVTMSNGLTISAGGFGVTGNMGFNGAARMSKPAIAGSRGGNAALASLLTQLAAYGLITDSTTA